MGWEGLEPILLGTTERLPPRDPLGPSQGEGLSRLPFPPDCESLIRRMLVVDPAKRITIAHIRQHRWVQAAPPLPPAAPTLSAHSYDSSLGDYDEQVLDLMHALGVDRQRTVEVSGLPINRPPACLSPTQAVPPLNPSPLPLSLCGPAAMTIRQPSTTSCSSASGSTAAPRCIPSPVRPHRQGPSALTSAGSR